MEIKTTELIGPALDWAVIEAQYGHGLDANDPLLDHAHPSINWAQGGPIIEREGISLEDPCNSDIDAWRGFCGGYQQYGPTPLVAAMRAYVASKLGDTVELPEELLCQEKCR